MAARRLLIILLILLGISTLAAALVPPRSLRDSTTGETTTQRTETATVPAAPPTGKHFAVNIEVGVNRFPVVVACSPEKRRKGRCEPIRVGDRMTLSAYSRKPAELEIPSFGLIGFAGPTAPAIFELLFDAAADYGVRNTATGKVMARIQVLPARSKPRSSKTPARAGSDRA
jgi:hypothetical protein